jgi:hypothetical protein
MPMKNIDLKCFPQDIVQHGVDFCIAASTEAVLAYHGYRLKNALQHYLFAAMCRQNEKLAPSIPSMISGIEWLRKRLEKPLDIPVVLGDPKTHDDWKATVFAEIDEDRPIIITKNRPKGGAHVEVILGYDDEEEVFLMFNPGGSSIQKHRNVGWNHMTVEIRSEFYHYSYTEALDDIPNGSHLLIVGKPESKNSEE